MTATRRRRGEDGISFEHRGPCSDSHRHRHCPGLWRGELTLGYTGDGKRQRRKVSGKTKAAVVDKLRDLRTQLDKGATPKAGYAHYTVRQAAQDWLAHGLDGRSPKTITKNQNVLEPILAVIGARKLRDLSAADVRQALAAMATGYSTAAVSMGHLALKRAIRHAEANDLVTRNVAALADTPKGREGRPSRSLTLNQAIAVITAARTLPVMELRPGLKDVRRPAALMHAYIVLSLLCGLRTEEARALRWAHVDLNGAPAASPPVPPHIAVWRSVRAHGDTKTEQSRRTLGLPAAAVQALRAWSDHQTDERLAAGNAGRTPGWSSRTTWALPWTRGTSGRCSSASAPKPAPGTAGPPASCAPPSSA
jgi:integrase